MAAAAPTTDAVAGSYYLEGNIFGATWVVVSAAVAFAVGVCCRCHGGCCGRHCTEGTHVGATWVVISASVAAAVAFAVAAAMAAGNYS